LKSMQGLVWSNDLLQDSTPWNPCKDWCEPRISCKTPLLEIHARTGLEPVQDFTPWNPWKPWCELRISCMVGVHMGVRWCNGTGSASWSRGCGFDSQPSHHLVSLYWLSSSERFVAASWNPRLISVRDQDSNHPKSALSKVLYHGNGAI
jgi:hypothetical protein